MRLRPSVESDDADITDLDLSRIDEDPITYFLTPAPSYEEFGDNMDFEMEFDAGIEDAKHPAPIVRSVSPSSLGGLSLPPPRLPTPPRRSASPDADHDLPATPEDSTYMHFASKGRPHSFGLPFSLRDFTEGKLGTLAPPKRSVSGDDMASRALFDSVLDPKVRTTPGPPRPVSRRSRSRKVAARRSPHAWREPSPDVWSIEEETEEALNSDIGDSVYGGDEIDFERSMVIDATAAKPKKRVRFVLPAKEDISTAH